MVIQQEHAINIDELKRLLAQTDWADTRDAEGLEQMVAHSLCVTARDESKLVGFARVLTDYTYRAFIEDVILDHAYRGNGVGTAIMHVMLDLLQNVQEIALGCSDENVAFYERFGFKRVGHACMHKMANQ